jgi:hypothetical protein
MCNHHGGPPFFLLGPHKVFARGSPPQEWTRSSSRSTSRTDGRVQRTQQSSSATSITSSEPSLRRFRASRIPNIGSLRNSTRLRYERERYEWWLRIQNFRPSRKANSTDGHGYCLSRYICGVANTRGHKPDRSDVHAVSFVYLPSLKHALFAPP